MPLPAAKCSPHPRAARFISCLGRQRPSQVNGSWIMKILLSMRVGVLTIVVANLALVAGCWWMSRGKGVGPGLRRAAVFLLALLGVAGGAVTYRAAYLRQETADRKHADLVK